MALPLSCSKIPVESKTVGFSIRPTLANSLPFLFMGYMSLLLVYALGFSDLNGNDIDKTKKTKDASKTTETKDVTPVEETLSVTAFEPFSALEKMSCKGKTKPYSKKRDPVQSSAKKNENLNNDVKKLELGAL